jgi:hypothetical protein
MEGTDWVRKTVTRSGLLVACLKIKCLSRNSELATRNWWYQFVADEEK